MIHSSISTIPHTVSGLIPWVIGHGYLLFFIAALIEGSLVTIAAGIVAALGYYNIFIIIGLSVLGDIGGDLIYYFIGYKSRKILSSRFFRYLGLTQYHIEKIEKMVGSHLNRALIIVKFSPLIGPPGLIVIGAAHVPFKKFFKSALSISIPKTLFFALIGFYSGQTYLRLSMVIKSHEYLLIGVISTVLLIYAIYQKIAATVTKIIESKEI